MPLGQCLWANASGAKRGQPTLVAGLCTPPPTHSALLLLLTSTPAQRTAPGDPPSLPLLTSCLAVPLLALTPADLGAEQSLEAANADVGAAVQASADGSCVCEREES